MTPVRAVIADDSVVYRSQIRSALAGIATVSVQGAYSSGKLALERVSQGDIQLLILDLEMPEMDGIAVLKEIKARGILCKVLVFSSLSRRGAEVTLEALRLGASDFVTKPSGTTTEPPDVLIRNLLEPKIAAFFQVAEFPNESLSPPPLLQNYPSLLWETFRPQIVLIGSSTGGPTALEHIFSQICGPLSCPIVIAQHMPPVFTAAFAERLSNASGLDVREAIQGEPLQSSRVYLAPGDFHLRLKDSPLGVTLQLDKGAPVHSVRPAVDPLFESASEIFNNKCLGIVLTGMGYDGANGAVAIKNQGGAVLIQSKDTCVVFGMPGAVAAKNAFDRELSPDEIAQVLINKMAKAPTHSQAAKTGAF